MHLRYVQKVETNIMENILNHDKYDVVNHKSHSIKDRKEYTNFPTERKFPHVENHNLIIDKKAINTINSSASLNNFSTQNTSKSKDLDNFRHNNLKNVVEVQLNNDSAENEKSPYIGARLSSSLSKFTLNTSLSNQKEIDKSKRYNELSLKLGNENLMKLNKNQMKKNSKGSAHKREGSKAILSKNVTLNLNNKSKKIQLRVNEYNQSILNSDLYKFKKESINLDKSPVECLGLKEKDKTKDSPMIKIEENFNMIPPKSVTKCSKVVALDLQKCHSDIYLPSANKTNFIPTIQTNLYENRLEKNASSNLNDQSVLSRRSSFKTLISLTEARIMKNNELINNSFTKNSKSLSKEKFSNITEQFIQTNNNNNGLKSEKVNNNSSMLNINTCFKVFMDNSNEKMHFLTDEQPNEIENIKTKLSCIKKDNKAIITKEKAIANNSSNSKEFNILTAGNNSSEEFLKNKFEKKLNLYRMKRKLTNDSVNKDKKFINN